MHDRTSFIVCLGIGKRKAMRYSNSNVSYESFHKKLSRQGEKRKVPPSAVENAIKNGTKNSGNTAGTTVRVSSDVKVVTNSNGKVITVIPQ